VYAVDGLAVEVVGGVATMGFKTRNKSTCSLSASLVKTADADQALPVGASLEYAVRRVATGVIVSTGVAFDGQTFNVAGWATGEYALEVVVNSTGTFSPVAVVKFTL
jgi:hypothetical protein